MHVCMYACKLAYMYMHMCMSVDTDKWMKRLADADSKGQDKMAAFSRRHLGRTFSLDVFLPSVRTRKWPFGKRWACYGSAVESVSSFHFFHYFKVCSIFL